MNLFWQSFIAEECVGGFSPQCEGGYSSHHNSTSIDQYGQLDALASHSETPSAADLERNVDPFADEMSPRIFQEMLKSVKEDIYPYRPFQGYNEANGMDRNLTFNECCSHGSQDIATSTSLYYTSQNEQLQLTTSSSFAESSDITIWNSTLSVQDNNLSVQDNTYIRVQPSSPSIQNNSCVQDSTSYLWDSTLQHSNQDNITCIQHSTPAMQCSEVQQVLSMNRLEVYITFKSDNSACICSNWYEKLLQVVPEVVKPQESTKRGHLHMKLPEGALPLVTWCNINRSGTIRVRIIQELARIIVNLHQNQVTKDLYFCGGLTLSESVLVTVEPCTEKPQLYIVPNMMTFWQFASTYNNKDSNTLRLGRLQDVKQFIKILEYAIMEPVKRKEFTVSCAFYSACKCCVEEEIEGDQMPIFYQRLAGKDGYDEAEGASNHYQSEHHHEPPIISHYEIQVKKLELELKEQEKKYSEQEKKYSEQEKMVQLLKEQVKEQDKEMQLFKEQVNQLQDRLVTPQGDVNANNDIDWLSKEQNTKVSMILTNPSNTWKIALRKILETVFGKKLLAQSCSVGRRHATYKALDARKLDEVKGLIFNTYGPNQESEITNETINVIVNSSCSSARRSMKQSV